MLVNLTDTNISASWQLKSRALHGTYVIVLVLLPLFASLPSRSLHGKVSNFLFLAEYKQICLTSASSLHPLMHSSLHPSSPLLHSSLHPSSPVLHSSLHPLIALLLYTPLLHSFLHPSSPMLSATLPKLQLPFSTFPILLLTPFVLSFSSSCHQVGGIYFGAPRGFGTNEKGERYGYNTMVYSESEVRESLGTSYLCSLFHVKQLLPPCKAIYLRCM